MSDQRTEDALRRELLVAQIKLARGQRRWAFMKTFAVGLAVVLVLLLVALAVLPAVVGRRMH